ncbi:MAG TPA: AAA family ATPase [Bryobacteraceae bacterium]|nr:AAA family ATPase [Bryobacteraceae bacterium]
MTGIAQPAVQDSLRAAHFAQLQNETAQLRLLLRRRTLWLRQRWGREAGGEQQRFAIPDSQANRLLAGEARQEENEFYRASPEVAAIDVEFADRERHLDLAAARLREAGSPPALDLLVEMFQLSRFERAALVLCLAPELDASFERLYAYLQDDATRRYPTPQLAVDVLSRDEDERRGAWLSFQPCGRLRHFRLLSMLDTGSLSSQPLRLAPRILSFFLGINQLDDAAEKLLDPVPAFPVPPHLAAVVEKLQPLLSARLTEGAWPRLNFYGPPDSGKRALARALCSRLGLGLYRLDLERAGSGDGDLWRVLERESVLLQFALYVPVAGAVAEGLRTIGALLGRLRVLLIVGTEEPLPAEWPSLPVALGKLPAVDREALWRQALSVVPNTAGSEIGSLVEAFEFGPSGVARTIWQASAAARVRSPEDGTVNARDLWEAGQAQAARGLSSLAQAIVPSQTWDDIVLPAEARRQLRDIGAQVANRHRVYTTWGFGDKLTRGRGISALFAGPSGTGKTMAAEILAGELGLHLYRIDLSAVVNKYIGETEKNLRRVFDAAERSGAILFFDEADALFGKRTEVKDSHDRYANIEIDYLLQRMEEYRGLAILATNMKSYLDQAFLRRLRFFVDFPFPDAESRRQIWQKSFPPGAPLADVRFDLLSRLEISGGNIRNIAVNGAFLAAAESSPIGMSHLMRAAADEYAKEEKLVTPAEFGAYYAEVRRP